MVAQKATAKKGIMRLTSLKDFIKCPFCGKKNYFTSMMRECPHLRQAFFNQSQPANKRYIWTFRKDSFKIPK